MHLSVPKETLINVIGVDGLPVKKPVFELLGTQSVYDWFGDQHQINIVDPGVEEQRWLAACPSGEIAIFGDTHSVLCREGDSGRWKRLLMADLDRAVYTHMIQKKVTPGVGLFDAFDIDDQGVFLEIEKATDFLPMMQKAAHCGVTVQRRKTELRVDVDKRRPPCFATKMFNGSLVHFLDETLSGLVAGGVVSPHGMFNDDYIEKVNKSGIIFEGASVYAQLPLTPARRLEKPAPVYHIQLDDPMTPVELTWCSS